MPATAKAVVFDMDGTLVDNMHIHMQAWFDFLSRYGIRTTEEEFHAKNAGTITEIIPRFFPEVTDPAEILRLGMEKEQVYRSLYSGQVTPLPGLVEFLDRLDAAGIPAGLATAADRLNIDFTIDELGIRDRFRAITGAEQVQKGKPDPDVYLKTAASLGIDPADCVAFEDSLPGIRSALSAGMRVVGVSTTHRREELQHLPLLHIIADYRTGDPVAFLNGKI